MYVIELDDGAALGTRADPPLPFLYVGVSKNTPKRRFELHKKGGITASKTVTRHGKKLRRDLYKQYKPVLEAEAPLVEQQLAADLRARGYVVDSGGVGLGWERLRRAASPRPDLP